MESKSSRQRLSCVILVLWSEGRGKVKAGERKAYNNLKSG